jgi:hypothetical protein
MHHWPVTARPKIPGFLSGEHPPCGCGQIGIVLAITAIGAIMFQVATVGLLTFLEHVKKNKFIVPKSVIQLYISF